MRGYKTLADYRRAFIPSRAKDDPTDAEFLLEILTTHRNRLRVWRADNEKTRKLQHLVEYRRKLLAERTRISNKLTAYLKLYFPQVLQWFPDVKTNLVCEFLLKYRTLEILQKAKPDDILELLITNGSRKKSKNEQRLEEIKTTIPLIKDKAIISSSSHSDYQIFSSLPGAGEVSASRMLAAFGTDRSRFSSSDQAARYFGIAPVLERSGNQEWIRWRYFCPKFLRQSFHEFANQSIRHSFWAGEYYKKQRARGKKHHTVVRALAYKWLRIIFRCWQDRKPYNEAIYLKALAKNSSTLLA